MMPPVVRLEQPVQLRDAVGVGHVAQTHRRQVLEHLIFQLIAVDHQQDRRLVRLRRFEKHFRGFDHRVGLAAALGMPDEAARELRVERPRYHPVHACGLMLAQHELLQLFVFFGEEDEVFEQAQQMRHRAKAFDLGFEIADLFMLPAKDIAPHRAPGRAVVEADRLGRGKEHLRHHDFRRLDVITADLIDAEGDRPLLWSRSYTR